MKNVLCFCQVLVLVTGHFMASVAAEDQPIDARFTAALQSFEASRQAEVTDAHDAVVQKLRAQFELALARQENEALKSGDLETVLLLRKERELSAKGAIPVTDGAEISETLKQLRGAWREQMAQAETARTAREARLLTAFAQQLAALEVTLTKERKIDQAVAVQNYRKSLGAKIPGDSGTAPGGISGQGGRDLLASFRDTPSTLPKGWSVDSATGDIVGKPFGKNRAKAMKVLTLDPPISGSYELLVEFTAAVTDKQTIQAAVTFPAGSAQATWLVGKCLSDYPKPNQQFGGVEAVNGLTASDPANPMKYTPSPLVRNQRHQGKLVITDRPGDTVMVQVFLDDKKLAEWTGLETSLSVAAQHWATTAKDRIGLGSNFGNGSVIWHSVILK